MIEETRFINLYGTDEVGKIYKISPVKIIHLWGISYSIIDTVYDRFNTGHIVASNSENGISLKRLTAGSTFTVAVTFVGR